MSENRIFKSCFLTTIKMGMYKFTKEGLVNNSANGNNCPVSCILCGNARPRTLCADDSAAAHIQRYMAAVTDNIAWLRFCVADASAAASLCC